MSAVASYTLTADEAAAYKRLVGEQVASANEYASTAGKAAIARSWAAADAMSAFENAMRERLGAEDLGYFEGREDGMVEFVYRVGEPAAEASA